MYLWDSNVLRHYGEQHPNLLAHLQRVSWTEIALPSVVVAEVLRGRCEFALKATPSEAPLAHQHLMRTWYFLQQFTVVVFDQVSAETMAGLQRKISTRKRYADVMIAATVLAGRHTLVTRNLGDFADLLPANQVENWIDQP